MGSNLGTKKKYQKNITKHNCLKQPAICKETTVREFYNLVTRNRTYFLYDLNFPYGEQQHTLLHLACSEENISVAEALLYAGAYVNAQDKKGRTPLDIAIIHCNLPLVKLLIKYNAWRCFSISTLVDLSQKENPEAGEHILEMLKFISKEVINNFQMGYVFTDILCQAVHSNDLNLASQVLQTSFVKLDEKNYYFEKAIKIGWLSMAQLLINHGALLMKDNLRATSLQMASKYGHTDIVDYLNETQNVRNKRLLSRADLPQKYHLLYFGIFRPSNSILYTDLGSKDPDVSSEIIRHSYQLEFK